MRNIVLIGMPGSGKTTFGALLAARLGRPFLDCDAYIEERERCSIPALFERGEEHFRRAETRAVRALAEREGLVIATGGGVIKRAENVACLRRTGRLFFIDRLPEAIVSDVAVSGRPLLRDGAARIFTLYAERIEAYRAAADMTVQNEGAPEVVAAALFAAVREMEAGK